MDRRQEGTRLEDIPIVKEFPDVFPDDISGLPRIEQSSLLLN